MPICDEVVRTLQRLRAQTQSRYVFLSLDRLTQVGAIQIRAFSQLQGEHMVGTTHDCRRTYCTVMADIVPPHRLQKLAGHASIETTLKFYIHTDDAWDD